MILVRVKTIAAVQKRKGCIVAMGPLMKIQGINKHVTFKGVNGVNI